MGLQLKIFQGTPQHGRSLCFECSNAHIIQGQAVSDLRVRCSASWDNPIWITRPVSECNEFERRMSQNKNEMEKIAWILETRKGKILGFYSAVEHKHRARTEEIDDPEE